MFRHRISLVWIGTLALAVLAGACTPAPTPNPTAAPLSLTDGLERVVTLAGPAQRIVSLGPSNTEILFALGAGAQVAGRDDLSDFPAEAASVPGVGATYGNFSVEAIVAVSPDLVLVSEIYTQEQVQSLADAGLTVYWLANPLTWDGLYANLDTVGRLTGREAEAQTVGASLQARVQAVTRALQGTAQRPTVFYELDATDPVKPYTVGTGTFVDLLITVAGGRNVGAALGTPYGQISSEELVIQNPEVVVLGDSAYGVTVDSVAQRAGWSGIAAVRNGRVFVFDDNLASRPGPRLVDGLEALAKLIHPELFK